MVFALERTVDALRLLSLEKNDLGYRVVHYDERPLLYPMRLLGDGALVNGLQEMQTALSAPISSLFFGVFDADVVIRHVCLPARFNLRRAYRYCLDKLGSEFSGFSKNYSWDAYQLLSYEGEGQLFLCVAYPLEKIVFLQQVFSLCHLRLLVLEPSVCAVARASFLLLKLSEALILLQENHGVQLLWVKQGEILGFWQMSDYAAVEKVICTFDRHLKILAIGLQAQSFIKQQDLQSIDLLPDLQGAQNVLLMHRLNILPVIGLAQRGLL